MNNILLSLFLKFEIRNEIFQAIQRGENYNSTNDLARNRVKIRTHAEVLVGEDRRTYHNTDCKWIFCKWHRYERVRNTGTEYGYGKEFAGLSTGTDYSQETKYGINTGTDSF